MADRSPNPLFNQWNPSTPHPTTQMYHLANQYEPPANQSNQEFSHWTPAPLRNPQNPINSFPSNQGINLFPQYNPTQLHHPHQNTDNIPHSHNQSGNISQSPQILNREANHSSTLPSIINYLPNPLPLVTSSANPSQSNTIPANPPSQLPVACVPAARDTSTLPIITSLTNTNPSQSNTNLVNPPKRPPVANVPAGATKKRIRPHKRLLPPHEQDRASYHMPQNKNKVNAPLQQSSECEKSQQSVEDPPSSQQSSNHEEQHQSVDDDAPGVPDNHSDDAASFEVALDLPSPFIEDAPPPAAHSQLTDTSPAVLQANNPVNHAMLQSLFNLDPERNAIAQKMVEMSQPDREAAMVYAVLSLQTRPSHLPDVSMGIQSSEAIPSTSISAPANVVAPINISTFVFSDTFKSHLRSFIRQTIMECKIESYHLEFEPKTSLVIDYSLIRMVTRWVAQLPQSEKNTWLPPGFSQKHPQAVKMVHQIVHDSVKWDKGTLRGCLLKNLVANSISRTVNGPMPTLNQLYAHIQQHLPRASEFTQDLTIPTQVMVRFAYLRLETIKFVRSGSNARAAAWGPIDAQLLFLRSQSADYNLSWSELILQKDRLLFGSGNEQYSQLTSCDMNMPSGAEVEENIEVGRRRRGTNAGESSQVQE